MCFFGRMFRIQRISTKITDIYLRFLGYKNLYTLDKEKGGSKCYEQKSQKNTIRKREVQLEADVETALSAADVSTVSDLADHF